MVACGPPGLIGGKNILYHNNGDGTFKDVSESAGIFSANGTYGLGVLTADFDNDGWPDIYVANDSTASALYQNLKNGKFSDIAMEAGVADFSPVKSLGNADARPVRAGVAKTFQLGDLIPVQGAQSDLAQRQSSPAVSQNRGDLLDNFRAGRGFMDRSDDFVSHAYRSLLTR